MYTDFAAVMKKIQGGEYPEDALSFWSFFAKEPVIVGLFYK